MQLLGSSMCVHASPWVGSVQLNCFSLRGVLTFKSTGPMNLAWPINPMLHLDLDTAKVLGAKKPRILHLMLGTQYGQHGGKRLARVVGDGQRVVHGGGYLGGDSRQNTLARTLT